MFVTVILITQSKFSFIQKKTDELNVISRENLIGVRVIRAYNAEGYQSSKFNSTNEELTKTNLFTNRVTSLFFPTIQLIMNLVTLSIYWIGAYLIADASPMEKIKLFSNMIVFGSYAIQIIVAFMLIVFVLVNLPRAVVSSRRINEVLQTDALISSIKNSVTLTSTINSIKLKDVSFKYSEEQTDYNIEKINLELKKSETTAIIGSTGSGKTTLVNLICRLFDPTSGVVEFDNTDIKKVELESLNSKVAMVPQNISLFSATVRENIGYGNDNIDDERVAEAIEMAQAKNLLKDFLKELIA